MLRVIAIVYLFSLANGLLWVALDLTFGAWHSRQGRDARFTPVEL